LYSDDIVGDVMKKLVDMGVDNNTIVVFTTDKGTEVFTWPDGGQRSRRLPPFEAV
jgi:arylsulfatase A-like enzyme